MSRSSRRGSRRLAAAALAITASMFLASCADNGSSNGGGESADSGSSLKIGMVNEQADPGTPTKGGTLTFSGYVPMRLCRSTWGCGLLLAPSRQSS